MSAEQRVLVLILGVLIAAGLVLFLPTQRSQAHTPPVERRPTGIVGRDDER